MSKSEGIFQVKIGAILSYILIIANAMFGICVTPFILKCLGESPYGVYRTIASLSSAVMVLDFGLGGTTMRYIAKYKADKEDDKIQPFVSMSLCEALVLVILVALISAAVFFNIQNLYANSFHATELALAKDLFAILAITMMLQIVENVLNGIITGHNNFALGNGIKLLRILARIVLYVVVLPIYESAVALVTVDLVLTLLIVVCEATYIRFGYQIKCTLNVRQWDMSVFKESFFYSFTLFLTSIVAQINNNLDNVVIGAIKGAEYVAVYSFGLLIFGMFEQLSTSISGVMLPTVTQTLRKENGDEKVQNLIVSVGRIQFMLLGAAVIGFAVIGKEFIELWLGKGYEDVYVISLILMIPALFELCVNVCLSVLRAKKMLKFRTTVLVSSTILNLIVTILGVQFWDYKAAAIGTAISFIAGSLIIMNIYYYKKLAFNMLQMYRQIFRRIWICIILGGGAIWVSSRLVANGWVAFVFNILVFCVVYGASLLLFGLTEQEKRNIPFFKKFMQ